MKKLTIVRHGETNWNQRNLLQGHADILLNGKGRLQAHELGKQIAFYPFDALISSDLLRARETAEIVQSYQQIPVSIESDCRLREHDFGQLDGKSIAEYFSCTSDKERDAFGVESPRRVGMRISDLLHSLASRPEQQFFLSTHGGVILQFYQLADLPAPHVHNCSVHRFTVEITGGKLILRKGEGGV